MQISTSNHQRSLRLFGARRRGNTFTFTLVAVCVAACLGLAGWFLFGHRSGADGPEFLTATVWKGPYDFAVVEQGTVESASNTELTSQVRSRSGSTTILDVVPEGTRVNEGDTVVELDSSGLLLEENAQKILVSTRESQLAQAENTLKAAEIAKREYAEGLYLSQEKLILSELFLAEQAKATAEAALESTKVLYAKTIVTGLQVQSAYASLEDALNKLNCAQTSLLTLRTLTRQKELTLLEAAIDSAEANVKTQQQSLQLEEGRLKDIQDQIAKCTIKATASGQVVYANETDMFRSSSQSQFIVTPGAMVRERQVIIRLPNADDMQVKATVNEARVTLVRVGMPVSIHVEALQDEMIEGEVTKVNQFAEPSGYSSGNIKKYATFVKIKNPPIDLRVGMNAEVRIHVERMPSALQVPVQTLAELKGHYFSLVKNGDEYETREVTISSTNDKVATIENGLQEGDEVIMNPRSTGALLNLPSLPDTTPVVMDEIKRTGRHESPARPIAESRGNRRIDDIDVSDMTPADMVAQYLENDANKDDKLSKQEIAKMDTRLQERLVTADANGDGFLERRELLMVAANAVQQSRGKAKASGDAGPGAGGRRGRGERNQPHGESAGGGV